MGYFSLRTKEAIKIKFPETEIEFKILKVFPFTPERKTMSVIV
jgi:magnesium-transporting ATPase (P-type)